MMRIAPDGEGRYTASARGETLGWCEWRAEGDATVITAASLADESDVPLLDGLLRAALFAGIEQGRCYGEIGEAVWEAFGGALARLGLPRGRFEVEKLPKQCEKGKGKSIGKLL